MNAEVNIPLLRKAVEWAEAEAAKPREIDRQWVQNSWVTPAEFLAADLLDLTDHECDDSAVAVVAAHCGTAFCIAGYVAQSIDARYLTAQEVDGIHVGVFAANALGIPDAEAIPNTEGGLFSGWNTIADVRRIAEELAGERL